LKELGYPSQQTLYFGESLGSGVVAAFQARHASIFTSDVPVAVICGDP
jgi:hypothetical protein